MIKLFRTKTWIIILLLSLLCATEAFANIVLRAVVVNPSSQKRTVPFKSYLPREIKPENVVDMGELEIAFDPKDGTYYVFKDFELGPKESMTVEIELQDVWKIEPGEILSLREEANKLTKVLANTDYYERAAYLKNSIETKLNQVEQSQKVVNPNPGGYISDYRDNIKLIESVKADLVAAKTLVAEAKNIAPMVTWKLIVAIVVFLAILGVIFFIIWQKQIKSLEEFREEFQGAEEIKRPGEAPEEGERRLGKEEKKSGISDIEDRLKEKQE